VTHYRFKSSLFVATGALALGIALPTLAAHAQTPTPTPTPPEPTRIVIEAEDMKGVDQQKFGAGPTWQVGRWGYDLHQNMIFGGVWASRLRVAMTDAGAQATDKKAKKTAPVEASTEITVPTTGTYKIWAKYEAPPFFNYAFGLRVQALDKNGKVKKGKPVFEKTYGLLDSPKHFNFTNKLTKGSLYWNWGIDHDAAEGYETALPAGRYRVTMIKTPNPAPAGARSVDTFLITSDLSEISSPRYPRYPLLDELRRANHVYFRFRNLSAAPAKINWNHWNHRYEDFYSPFYLDKVRYYDAQGKPLEAKDVVTTRTGTWQEPVAAGAVSVWHDLGPTMNVESTSPYTVKMLPVGAKANDPSVPVEVDIALAPNEKSIVKSFKLAPGEPVLGFLVQPDLYRPDGVKYSVKFTDIYRDVAEQLNKEPRLGPIPKQIKFYAFTGSPGYRSGSAWDLDYGQGLRHAMGLNTIDAALDKDDIHAVIDWWKDKGGIIERSVTYQHSQDVAAVAADIKKKDVEKYISFLSYGDEIGLPAIDITQPALLDSFREFVKKNGETPQSLGVENWEQVKPLQSLSSDVAVKIGVLPEGTQSTQGVLNKLKRLYWYSSEFRIQHGIEEFATKTRTLKAALTPQIETSANLGGMHPFFWMHQSSFIEAFKHNAMSLAWSEDYTYTQPEGSRLVVDFEAAYLRKGTSYNGQRMQFYVMPHWPGNTPQHLMQNAMLLWAQNVKDIDWFNAGPDIWATENYIAYRGGLPMWKMLRTISGMAGAIENDLLPAKPDAAPVAMLLSEASDVWELEGGSQGGVFPAENGKPATVASNISQEERKAIWYALRLAGYRVDMLTEKDVQDGLLKNYKAVYVCGQNMERKAADAMKTWVEQGGVIFATAGAARKNEFDEPLTTLDGVLGRGAQKSYQRYRGPLRAKMELLFEKPIDKVQVVPGVFDALASQEIFETAPGAEVLARYAKGNGPALVKLTSGKGVGYYTGTLPGQAFLKKGMPVKPAGKGGDVNNFSHFQSTVFDEAARAVILRPLLENNILPDTTVKHQNVATGRLSSPASIVLPIVNLAEQSEGQLKNLEITLGNVPAAPKKVWSPFHPNGMPFKHDGDKLNITLPALQTGDVIVVSK